MKKDRQSNLWQFMAVLLSLEKDGLWLHLIGLVGNHAVLLQ